MAWPWVGFPGPHGKDLWYKGSLDRPPLWDQGCSEWSDLRGVSTQKWWCLGGPKSSKPWQRDAHVDVSVMTIWRKKEGFLFAFSLVHTLKRQCAWKMIFFCFFIWPLKQAVRAVLLETFFVIENFFLCLPPSMNGFSWGVLHQQAPVFICFFLLLLDTSFG